MSGCRKPEVDLNYNTSTACVTVMVSSRRSPGSEHGVGVMHDVSSQDHFLITSSSRPCFAFSSRSLLRMLVACCSSTSLPIFLPISLNSLDLAGVRLLSPRDSPDTITTVSGADDVSTDDATELKWEFDEERGRYYVSFPDDQ